MPRKQSSLRAVTPDEKPSRKKLTVTQAADAGTQRELLVAMRGRLARAVEDPNTPARDLAALSRRLLEVVRDIEAIDSSGREDDVGQAAATADESWDESAI